MNTSIESLRTFSENNYHFIISYTATIIAAVCSIITVAILVLNFFRQKREFDKQYYIHILELNYAHKLKCYSDLFSFVNCIKNREIHVDSDNFFHNLSNTIAQAEILCDKQTYAVINFLVETLYDFLKGDKTEDELDVVMRNCLDVFRRDINGCI